MPRVIAMMEMGASVREIARQDGMPDEITLRRWGAREEWASQYARAREDGIDAHVDQMLDIAASEPDPQRARVMIDAIKWRASKLMPKRYGDRLEVGGTVDLFVSAIATARAKRLEQIEQTPEQES